MTHWGWYWKVKRQHKSKSLCNYRTCIDSFKLFKRKDFIGFVIKDGEKEVVNAEIEGNYLVMTSEQLSYNIQFEKQSCNFGGFRFFFRCPVPSCNRRMRKLYRYSTLFVCRKCLNLGYYSQRVTASRRFWLMQKKITDELERLGGSLYRKPKWMRWKTFEKYKAKERDFDCKSESAEFEECYKMYGFYP